MIAADSPKMFASSCVYLHKAYVKSQPTRLPLQWKE